MLAAVLAGLILAAGCGRNEFKDRTAKVTVDGRATSYQVDSCGLDGSTLFVVGRASSGDVLQAVVGLGADAKTGVIASTGLTLTYEGADLAAFGAESWARRGQTGEPPGRITRSTLRGSRIQVAGRLAPVDADGSPTAGGTDADFSLDARCDDQTS